MELRPGVPLMFGSSWVALVGGLTVAAALAAYILVAGRAAPPRVRWFLVGAAAASGAVIVVPVLPFGSSETVGIVSYSPAGEVPPVLRETTDLLLVFHQWLGTALLVLGGCLAAAVSALPVRYGVRRAVTVAVVGLLPAFLLLAGPAWEVATDVGFGAVLGAAWPAMLAGLVATVAAVLGVRRAGLLAGAGGMLVAMVGLVVAFDAINTLAILSPSGWRAAEGDAFLQPGARIGWSDEGTNTSGVVLAAALLAGPWLFAVGCLTRRRSTPQPAAPVTPE